MAKQIFSLIKFRRGKEADRKKTKFEEGEPLYVVDKRRMFIGVGNNNEAPELGSETMGGTLVSNLTFEGPINNDPIKNDNDRIYEGDIIYANNKVWRYNGSTFTDLSVKVDNVTIGYDSTNKLQVLPTALNINGGNGINVANNTVSIINSGNNILKVINDELTLPENSVTANYISQDFFNSNQFTLKNDTWSLNLDYNYFSTNGPVKILKVPAGEKTDTIEIQNNQKIGTVNAIISERFNNISSAQNSGISQDPNNNLVVNNSLKVIGDSSNTIIGAPLAVHNIVSGNETTDTNFNGSISSDLTNWDGNNRKIITVYDTTDVSKMDDSTKINLTSAGFIILESGETKVGNNYKRFAVPVYELPPPPKVLAFYNEPPNNSYFPNIQGFNLAGAKFYYMPSGTNTKTYVDVTITAPTSDTYDQYILQWDYEQTAGLSHADSCYIETVSGIENITLEPIPSFISVTQSLESNNKLLKIVGHNLSYNEDYSNTQISYTTKADPETYILVNGPINGTFTIWNTDFINIQLGSTSQTGIMVDDISELASISVKVNGYTSTYEL